MRLVPGRASIDARSARFVRAEEAPSRRSGSRRGQSLVEFALVLPVMLLIVVGGIDLGRVFLGWVSLNNTTRIAASYAASNAVLVSSGNVAALTSYNSMVQHDTMTTNCVPPNPIPPPVYTPNAGVGGTATVSLTCQFQVLTPILSSILGGHVSVSASSSFPVRTGVVAGSASGPSAPVVTFTLTPTSGAAPLTVAFTNTTSPSGIATWAWDFGNGVTSILKDPPPVTYTAPGSYTVTLTASNGIAAGSVSHIVTVTAPPGPVAAFTMNPPTGTAPLAVTFTNTSTGSVATWAWNLGNGTTSTLQTPPGQTYAAGTYTVTLTVTDSFGQSSTAQQTLTVTAPVPTCTIPDFKNVTTATAIDTWTSAGFQGKNLIFDPARPPEFKITKQSIIAGTVMPCLTTVLTVYNH
jgi:PKD repeat protein